MRHAEWLVVCGVQQPCVLSKVEAHILQDCKCGLIYGPQMPAGLSAALCMMS